MITGSQCRAGRALVEVTRGKLSLRSGVDEAVIEGFERKLQKPEPEAIAALQAALRSLGPIYRGERRRHRGTTEVQPVGRKTIARLESEGGIVSSDRVP